MTVEHPDHPLAGSATAAPCRRAEGAAQEADTEPAAESHFVRPAGGTVVDLPAPAEAAGVSVRETTAPRREGIVSNPDF
jgi:hypothetical protein